MWDNCSLLSAVHRNVIWKRQVYGTIRIHKKWYFWKIFKIPGNSHREFQGPSIPGNLWIVSTSLPVQKQHHVTDTHESGKSALPWLNPCILYVTTEDFLNDTFWEFLTRPAMHSYEALTFTFLNTQWQSSTPSGQFASSQKKVGMLRFTRHCRPRVGSGAVSK